MTGDVLYGYSGAGSAAVELALTAAGLAYDFRDMDRTGGELARAAFTRINPLQQVPVLITPEGDVVTEVPAILNHLADTHPASGLAPPPGSRARAQHDRWLASHHANVYEGILRIFYSDRYTSDPAGVAGVKAAAEAYVSRMFGIFEPALGAGPYFAGAAPEGVDLFAWTLGSWVDRAALVAACPGIGRVMAGVEADPRLAAVAARNF